MPQPKKPVEKRQRRNHADVGMVVREVSSSPVPQADQGWREGTVERWVTFWGSPSVAPGGAVGRGCVPSAVPSV
jgi:hypothetical protein